MTSLAQNKFIQSASFIHILVLLSGCAALSWEVIWQIKSSLALGFSAWGTAITLAITMGGMSAGAILMGNLLREKKALKPVRIYGYLEIIVGLCGICLGYCFKQIELIDSWAYNIAPELAYPVFILSIVAVLGLPAICLGATLPVIGLTAQKHKISIALLYGINTIGAAAGTIIAAFILIPLLGIQKASLCIAAINLIVGVIAVLIDTKDFKPKPAKKKKVTQSLNTPQSYLVVFITGFVIFVLEVAWFRSLTAAFQSTTDAFAIMLACVLIALGLSARAVPWMRKNNVALPPLLAYAGIMILLITPLIERFDLAFPVMSDTPYKLILKWFMMTFVTIAMPVFLIGTALPRLLDEQDTPRKWGRLYGFNAIAAITGAIYAGWVLLPVMGFAMTAWMAGLLVAIVGIELGPSEKKYKLTLTLIASLIIAVGFESGVGKTRVQSAHLTAGLEAKEILASYDGPDSTLTAIQTEQGFRMLIIDGFIATAQLGEEYKEVIDPIHYMPWMGHLPMLLHPKPKDTLVIAFGTGQTAHALRQERAGSIDIVDLNKRVFDMAPIFTMNEGILEDEISNPIVMDGRAFIRRTKNKYDVITLEPMPPNFAGVNALYSKEFYEFAYERMNDDGIIAQWVPFNLVPAEACASITKTMQSVFPNSILWIDPLSWTAILVGSKNNAVELGRTLYGYNRKGIYRDLTKKQVRDGIALNPDELKEYSSYGTIISDDNQYLAYGKAVYQSYLETKNIAEGNRQLLEKATGRNFAIPEAPRK